MKKAILVIIFVLALIPVSRLKSQPESESPFYQGGEREGLLGLFKQKEKPPEAEEDLYQEALSDFEGKPTWLAKHNPEQAEKAKEDKYLRFLYFRRNYQRSIELFQKLIYEYPFTKHLAEADFYIAEAYYQTKDYDIALQAYQDFLVRHPRNPRAEYVHYQIGLCHFQKRQKQPLRDQSETEAAWQAFKLLLILYPQTGYQKDAEDYLKKCEELLAERELKVADFYYKKKEYWSASLRYHRAWSEYNNTSKADYALFRVGICFQKMGRDQDAIRVFGEFKNIYPESDYREQTEEYLKKLNEKAENSKKS